MALAYAQLVVGANLRHLPLTSEPTTFSVLVMFHVLLALAIVAHVAMLVVRAWRRYRGETGVFLPTMLLGGLIVAQLLLGTLTWIENYGFPAWTERWHWAAAHTVAAHSQFQSLVTTAHVAVGSLIVATALVVRALEAGRLAQGSRAGPRGSLGIE